MRKASTVLCVTPKYAQFNLPNNDACFAANSNANTTCMHAIIVCTRYRSKPLNYFLLPDMTADGTALLSEKSSSRIKPSLAFARIGCDNDAAGAMLFS
jgi:hypothetical protein